MNTALLDVATLGLRHTHKQTVVPIGSFRRACHDALVAFEPRTRIAYDIWYVLNTFRIGPFGPLSAKLVGLVLLDACLPLVVPLCASTAYRVTGNAFPIVVFCAHVAFSNSSHAHRRVFNVALVQGFEMPTSATQPQPIGRLCAFATMRAQVVGTVVVSFQSPCFTHIFLMSTFFLLSSFKMDAQDADKIVKKLFELDMNPEYRASLLETLVEAMTQKGPSAENDQRQKIKAKKLKEKEKKEIEENTTIGKTKKAAKDRLSEVASSLSSAVSSASRALSPTKKDPVLDVAPEFNESCKLGKHKQFEDKVCNTKLAQTVMKGIPKNLSEVGLGVYLEYAFQSSSLVLPSLAMSGRSFIFTKYTADSPLHYKAIYEMFANLKPLPKEWREDPNPIISNLYKKLNDGTFMVNRHSSEDGKIYLAACVQQAKWSGAFEGKFGEDLRKPILLTNEANTEAGFYTDAIPNAKEFANLNSETFEKIKPFLPELILCDFVKDKVMCYRKADQANNRFFVTMEPNDLSVIVIVDNEKTKFYMNRIGRPFKICESGCEKDKCADGEGPFMNTSFPGGHICRIDPLLSVIKRLAEKTDYGCMKAMHSGMVKCLLAPLKEKKNVDFGFVDPTAQKSRQEIIRNHVGVEIDDDHVQTIEAVIRKRATVVVTTLYEIVLLMEHALSLKDEKDEKDALAFERFVDDKAVGPKEGEFKLLKGCGACDEQSELIQPTNEQYMSVGNVDLMENVNVAFQKTTVPFRFIGSFEASRLIRVNGEAPSCALSSNILHIGSIKLETVVSGMSNCADEMVIHMNENNGVNVKFGDKDEIIFRAKDGVKFKTIPIQTITVSGTNPSSSMRLDGKRIVVNGSFTPSEADRQKVAVIPASSMEFTGTDVEVAKLKNSKIQLYDGKSVILRGADDKVCIECKCEKGISTILETAREKHPDLSGSSVTLSEGKGVWFRIENSVSTRVRNPFPFNKHLSLRNKKTPDLQIFRKDFQNKKHGLDIFMDDEYLQFVNPRDRKYLFYGDYEDKHVMDAVEHANSARLKDDAEIAKIESFRNIVQEFFEQSVFPITEQFMNVDGKDDDYSILNAEGTCQQSFMQSAMQHVSTNAKDWGDNIGKPSQWIRAAWKWWDEKAMNQLKDLATKSKNLFGSHTGLIKLGTDPLEGEKPICEYMFWLMDPLNAHTYMEEDYFKKVIQKFEASISDESISDSPIKQFVQYFKYKVFLELAKRCGKDVPAGEKALADDYFGSQFKDLFESLKSLSVNNNKTSASAEDSLLPTKSDTSTSDDDDTSSDDDDDSANLSPASPRPRPPVTESCDKAKAKLKRAFDEFIETCF